MVSLCSLIQFNSSAQRIAHTDTSQVYISSSYGERLVALLFEPYEDVTVYDADNPNLTLLEQTYDEGEAYGIHQRWYFNGQLAESITYERWNLGEILQESQWDKEGRMHYSSVKTGDLEQSQYLNTDGLLTQTITTIESPQYSREITSHYYLNGRIEFISLLDTRTDVGSVTYFYPLGHIAADCFSYLDTSYVTDEDTDETIQVIQYVENCDYFSPKGDSIDEEEYDFILGKMNAIIEEKMDVKKEGKKRKKKK